MTKTITFLLLPVFLCSLIGCKEANKTQETTDKIQLDLKKDAYLKRIEELNIDFFKNHDEIEKVVLNKLENEGSEYFIENKCYDILARFESTLELYCQICEKLNIDNTGGLLTSYLHLNDTANVKKQYELMKDDENAFIYKEFHKYRDAGKTLESKYISIKYDERVEAFANAVFTHVNDIEDFITQEWDGLLPPKIRVILLYSDGPGPYNPSLNETFLPVKSTPISNSFQVAGSIVHETFHLVNLNFLEQKCKFEMDSDMNSFKFLDEGSAQLIESKFMNKFNENRAEVDEYSKSIVLDNTFDFNGLKTSWFELFSSPDVHIYSLAYSFAYFLEEKYGEEKYKALFLPTTKITEDSWIAYVENYFDLSIDELIEEWKQKLKQ